MENDNVENDNVQKLRDMVRPILTLILATSFVSAVLLSLITMLWVMTATNKFEMEKVVALIAILGTPFGMMMTYHFMKSNKKDSATTP